MAKGLRVGPIHRADSAAEATAAATAWLDQYRPTRRQRDYIVHVKPEQTGRWQARIEATWTPTPQPKRSHHKKQEAS